MDESSGGDVEDGTGCLRLWGGFNAGRVEQEERDVEARANAGCVAMHDDFADESITAAEIHDAARDGTSAWEQVVNRLFARLQGRSVGNSMINRNNVGSEIWKEDDHVSTTTAAVSAAVVESCR
jgi:hypothetical protein